jgi:two-component system chemotaxis sensor kinase CheA
MIDNEILMFFLDEATDNLTTWEKECFSLERKTGSTDYDAIFRCAHNLKGSSKSVGLMAFGDIVHKIEDVISYARKNKIPYEANLGKFLFDAQSFLLDWINQLKNDNSFVPTNLTILEMGKSLLDGWLGISPTNSSQVSQAPEAENHLPDVSSSGLSAEDMAVLKSMSIDNISELSESAIKDLLAIGKMSVAPEIIQQAPMPKEVAPVVEVHHEVAAVKNPPNKKKGGETLRVSEEKIDSLVRIVGELCINQSILKHLMETGKSSRDVIFKQLGQGEKIIKEIQSQTLALRMFPVEIVFSRLERVAVDTARALGKQLEVVIQGKEVELDKIITEKILDPLIHIVRNAVDHGVEMPEIREQRGKSKSGIIQLVAENNPSGVSIRIQDDGNGLHRDKILKKAIERGLVKEGQEISDQAVLQLLFLPGFSTADKITDVSGRGVGMDVVKRAIEELGGKIDLVTNPGSGSLFSISLPTSLSIIEGFVVEVDQEKYVVAISDLLEIVDSSEYEMETQSKGSGPYFNLRGEIIPVEYLYDYLPQSSTRVKKSEAKSKARFILLTNDRGKKVGFLVDAIGEQQSIVARNLPESLKNYKGISGSTILKDGSPGLIINLGEITKYYLNKFDKDSDIKRAV